MTSSDELMLETPGLRGRLLKHERLAHYTSWRIGGAADYVYLPADLADLSSFLRQLPEKMPLTWMGLGSNTLVRDGGIEGVVVITQGGLKQIDIMKDGLVRVEAGVASSQFARYVARRGVSGLAFMAGIPGTIGGALAMNAGCFGSETWLHVDAVETINRSGELKIRLASDFTPKYRHVERPEAEWFIAGHFRAASGEKEKALNEIRLLLDRRNSTQPTGTANCGSVFRNPPDCFAAQLIEQCGLKGKTLGGASVSVKHANFIINHGEATSADIENLIKIVKETVHRETGIDLTTEVCVIGRE